MKYFFVLEKGEDGKPVIDENETYPAYLEVKVAVKAIKQGDAVFSCELGDESFEKTIDGTNSGTVKASVLSESEMVLVEAVSLESHTQDLFEDDNEIPSFVVPLQQPKQVDEVANLNEGNPNAKPQIHYFVLDVTRNGSASPRGLDEGRSFTGHLSLDEAIAEKKRVEPKNPQIPIQKAIFVGAFLPKENNQFSSAELQQAYDEGNLIRDWNIRAVVKNYLLVNKELDENTISSYVKSLSSGVATDSSNSMDEQLESSDAKQFADEKDNETIRAIHLLHLCEQLFEEGKGDALDFIVFAMVAYNWGLEETWVLPEAICEQVKSYLEDLTSENVFEKFYPHVAAEEKQQYLDLATGVVKGLVGRKFQWSIFESTFNELLQGKQYYFVLPADASGNKAVLEELGNEVISIDGYSTLEEAETNLKALQKNQKALLGIFGGKFAKKASLQFSIQELQGAQLVRLWNDAAVIKRYLHQDKKLAPQTIERYVAELNGVVVVKHDEDDALDIKQFANENDVGVIRAVHLLHLWETQKNANNLAVMTFIRFAMTTYNYASFGQGALHKAFLSFVSSYEKYSELTSDNAFEKFYPDIKDAQIKQRYLELAESFVKGLASHGFQWTNFETGYNQLLQVELPVENEIVNQGPQKFDFAQVIREYLSDVHKLNDTVVNAYLEGQAVDIESKSKAFADESNKGIIRAINLLKLLGQQDLSKEGKDFVLFSILVHKYNTFTEGGLRSKLFGAYTADLNQQAQGLKLDTDSVYQYFYPKVASEKTKAFDLKAQQNPFFAAKKQAKESIVDARKQEYLSLAGLLKDRLVEHDFDVTLAVEAIKETLNPEFSTPKAQPENAQ